MKKFFAIYSLFFFMLALSSLQAQNKMTAGKIKEAKVAEILAAQANGTATNAVAKTLSPDQDCSGAIQVNQAVYYQVMSYSGTGAIAGEINGTTSCLTAGEQNDVWYVFTPLNSGNIGFLITPNVLTDDYDWAVFDLTNASCADIATNPALELSCNFSGTAGATGPDNSTGLTVQGAGGTPFNAHFSVVAGGTYLINVSNFSGTQNGYTLEFTSNVFSAGGQINGTVYHDANSNCSIDVGELAAPSPILQVTNPAGSTVFASGSGQGTYNFWGTLGNYTMQATAPNYYAVTCPSTSPSIMNLQTAGQIITQDFGLSPTSTVNDLRISLTPGAPATPNSDVYYYLTYQNVGTTTMSGSVDFTIDPNAGFISSAPTAASSTGTTYNWTFNGLIPFASGNIAVLVHWDPTLLVGTPLSFSATVSPTVGDATPANNSTTLNQIALASYDPNMKEVDKSAILVNDIPNGEYLTYTIHFQNTGTYYAETVKLVDSLSSLLQIESIEVLSASHPYTWSLVGSGVLRVTYNNIHLDWEAQNEPASHGFIKFLIKAKQNLVLGDIIKNKAYIYFDFNTPIITNEATTEIVKTTALTAGIDKGAFAIFPNPASQSIHIKSPNINENYTLQVIDLQGKVLTSTSIDAKNGEYEMPLDRSKIMSGMYLIQIKTSAGIWMDKLILN